MNTCVRRRMESDVLVVDDSAAIRKILQRVLRQTGMAIRTIYEAGDGQEALSLLAGHPGRHDHHRGRGNQGRGGGKAGRRRVCPQAIHRRSDQGEAGWISGADLAMNVHQLIVDSIHTAASNVFSTMLGGDLGPGADSVTVGAPEPADGIVSFIGIAGAWAGTGSLSCSSAMACALYSQLLMTDAQSVD